MADVVVIWRIVALSMGKEIGTKTVIIDTLGDYGMVVDSDGHDAYPKI